MTFIPEHFRQDMIVCFGQERAEDWLERLTTILARCAERWQLTILPPVENLSFHYVAPAVRTDGTPVIVKACSPTGEFAREAEALRLFHGEGMARLLEVDSEHAVMLLERLMPGTVLAQLVPEEDERAISILTSVMRQLWQPAPAQHPFPTVADWAKGLGCLRARYDGGCGPFPKRLVEEAETLFAELLATAGPPMLLHGDLHHENVLRVGNTWRAIDPKGLVGDPGYEIGVLFYNPMPQLSQVPDLRKLLARRIDQLAEELEMDRARVRGWGMAQCVLSAWWHIEDGYQAVPHHVLASAEIMSTLK